MGKFLKRASDLFQKIHVNINTLSALLESDKRDNHQEYCVETQLVGIGILGIGTEILVLQILENLKKGFLLTAFLGERALVESLINVDYMFLHPDHLQDKQWVNKLCKDYWLRPYDAGARKNRLGEKSLMQRSAETKHQLTYSGVYEDLSNYAHLLGRGMDYLQHDVFQMYTVMTAIHTLGTYQAIIESLTHFFNLDMIKFPEDCSLMYKEAMAIIGGTKKFKNIKFPSFCPSCCPSCGADKTPNVKGTILSSSHVEQVE